MAEHLGHERLNVYQKGMLFASMRKSCGRPAPAGCGMLRQLSKAVRADI